MSSKAMSLKGHINNYAKQHHIAAQVVLQNYTIRIATKRFIVQSPPCCFVNLIC